ncbi:MAG: excinuclease ABC subunit UvrA [Candidatus Binatia bacterium]|nr:excinuclease ABC subunit UvrA [Candidatus Binatia bacterium]
MKEPIQIRGARTHNLREVTCEFPPAVLTVVTGVSGSGKSSLVFDTLYAEGQRRFVQSMSTYSRMFLERMERPDVDFISNIPPAIALAQKNTIRNARSTVGTITEINDHLRLVYAHVGEATCTACGGRVARDDPHTGLLDLEAMGEGTAVLVVAPVEIADLPLENVATGLRKQGYRRLWIDGKVIRLDEESDEIPELPKAAETAAAYGGRQVLPVVIDRLTIGTTRQARCREALEAAFALARGRALLVPQDGGDPRTLDRRFTCRDCGLERGELVPHLFSFNSPLGACPECQGFGRVAGLDLDKVIPDPRVSLDEGAVAPWTTPSGEEMWERMLAAAKDHGIRTKVPWKELRDEEKAFVLDGEPTGGPPLKGRRKRFKGVHGFFRWLERKRYRTHVRVLIARYRGYTPCGVCLGARLQPDALAVRVGGWNIAELTERPIAEALTWADTIAADPRISARAATLLSEVRSRLGYLMEVGLDYLTLGRQARTLSGGEAQRIHLASALGSALTDTLYCLDEPTVGLHARDSARLLGVLRGLTEAGNTVVVVEHDPSLIEGADNVIDLGPGGGAGGGQVLYAGPPEGLPKDTSTTARFLEVRGDDDTVPQRGAGKAGVRIEGARENNLQNVTVTIPAKRLVCLTGVSGSGKSSLAEQVLYNGHLREQGEGVEAGACDAIRGLEAFDEVVLMNQAPAGRSSRSNAATYLKAYDEIRKLLAATTAARQEGIPAGHFSFNSNGGRCEECGGMGTVTLEMHFMADLEVACEQCSGTRFKPHVLEVRYRGRNVNEILGLTIDEAREFFSERPRIRDRFAALSLVGLGYITLGQATSTLSGGEAQRLKLASFIDAGNTAQRLLIFDEPTTGLHLSDVARLVRVLHDLVDRGNTILVVEHNLDFIAAADWVIDLGPGGGDRGGQLVGEGTPRDLACGGGTPTADALAEIFGTPTVARDPKPAPKTKVARAPKPAPKKKAAPRRKPAAKKKITSKPKATAKKKSTSSKKTGSTKAASASRSGAQ